MTNYLSESTFWYYFGHLVWDNVSTQINESLIPMNEKAKELGIPVEWKHKQAIPWATCCRVYILSKQHVPNISRKQFQALRTGVSASISPRDFFSHALQRILGNVDQPALPNRQMTDSVADTFAVGSINYLVPDNVAEKIHARVLEFVVKDEIIHGAALLAIASENKFWDHRVEEYRKRRPGWIKRIFSNADKWLFQR